MIKRLRIKFVCINMAIVTVILVMIFSTIFHFTQENLKQQNLRAMEMAASGSDRPSPPGPHPDRILKPFFSVTVNPDGNIALDGNYFFDLSDQELIRELVQTVSTAGHKQGLIPKYQLRFSSYSVPAGQKIIFLDISDEVETLQSLFISCLAIGALSLAAFLCISILLANWAIRPVEDAWNQQRQFIADASHELKTPLTVIMTNAELLQDSGYDTLQRQQFTQSILATAHQMRSLVEGLLELARMDGGIGGQEQEPVNLSELVADTLLLFEPVYFEKGLKLEGSVQEAFFVSGSRPQLQQVLEILLDNGAKYSTPGGTVRVQLKRQGRHFLLSVAGPGAAINQADLQNIFKRFYRIDKARSRNGSYGLGLSIAQNIISLHGGKIWAESVEGTNTFFVQLEPLCCSVNNS